MVKMSPLQSYSLEVLPNDDETALLGAGVSALRALDLVGTASGSHKAEPEIQWRMEPGFVATVTAIPTGDAYGFLADPSQLDRKACSLACSTGPFRR